MLRSPDRGPHGENAGKKRELFVQILRLLEVFPPR